MSQLIRGLQGEEGFAPPGGTPPMGYRAERVQHGSKRDGSPRMASRWVPDANTAPRVARAFEMYAEGRTLPEIHSETRLYHSVNCYSTMIRNRSYLGIAKFGEEEFPGHHAGWYCKRFRWEREFDLCDGVSGHQAQRPRAGPHS